jgi:hypothetical protein
MIYICYGMTKSASTYLYQLTEELSLFAGRKPARLGSPFRPVLSLNNYFDRIDLPLVREIAASIGRNDVVLKTHGPPDPEIAARVARGEILASASMRDLREIALSMVDHGARSRRWGYPEFSECRTPIDALPSLDNQVATFRLWAAIPRMQTFSYNEICFDTAASMTKLAAQIGVAVDIETVIKPFRYRNLIGQFSKGAALRYREMPLEQQQLFLDRYASFYEDFSLETPEAVRVAAVQESDTLRPRGQMLQYFASVSRRMRL